MLPDPEDLIPIIFSSVLCLVLIGFRCGYRLFRGCKIHKSCFRTWHRDDGIMALSLLILAARATVAADSRVLSDKVASEGLSAVVPSVPDLALARKLIIPARVFYALFLWCQKYCLLDLFSRLTIGLFEFERAAFVLRISLAVSFVAGVLSTVLECRPFSLYWNGLPAGDLCRQARANYITVGILDIATDLALLIFPIPLVRKASMDLKKRLRLAAVFSAGSLVVIVTLVRLPITLRNGVPQKTRSLWADIEISCACLVTNIVSFYYPLARDILNGHRAEVESVSASESSQIRSGSVPQRASYVTAVGEEEEEEEDQDKDFEMKVQDVEINWEGNVREEMEE